MEKQLIGLYFCILASLCRGESLLRGEDACRVLIDSHDRAAMLSRNYIGGQSNRWPNGVVPYTISSSFSAAQRSTIMNSMKHISDRTCVTFVERSNEGNYVDIFTGESGCYANLGYSSSRTRSVLHLQSNGCVFQGIVVHELLHILGFGHEQTRSDRDEYIQIIWGNIRSGTYSNFWRALGENEAVTVPYCGNVGIGQYDNCHAGFRASTFGIGYDYGSVMHYGLNFFTNNGQDTMRLKQSTTVQIPNRVGMSQLDTQKTRVAYQCTTDETTTKQPETTTQQPVSSTTKQPETTTQQPASSTDSPQTSSSASSSSPWPTTTAVCRDTWHRCEEKRNLCGRRRFMNRRCKKTCFNCECENQIADESCMVLGGYCRFRFIQRFCAKECGQC